MTPQIVRDASTIFSIVPFDIKEFKPGIYPGNFNIPACKDPKYPSRLVIDRPSKHAMTVGGKKDPIMIDTATYVLAKSVVDDFLSSALFTDPESLPGITWIQGDISLEKFESEYGAEYHRILESQRRWYLKVIRETDKEWVQSKNNVKVVSDVARHAVKELKLDKPWAKEDIEMLRHASCPACGTNNPPSNIICTNCRCVLDKARYAELQFA